MVPRAFKFILVCILVLGVRGAAGAQEDKPTSNSQLPAAKVALPDTSTKAAEPQEEPKEETREKTLEGEVAGVSPNFIAIDYGQDEKSVYEMTFNITKTTRLERIKDVKSLKTGDTVQVNYDEKVVKFGKREQVKERILKMLRLLNPAKVEAAPAVATASTPENDTLDDKAENSGEGKE
jgi:hypothetical protein